MSWIWSFVAVAVAMLISVFLLVISLQLSVFVLNGLSFFGFDSSKVWAIADSKRQGYLGFKEFVFAMQV